MERADSKSVLRFAIRCSIFELQEKNTFLVTDRHDKIIYIDYHGMFFHRITELEDELRNNQENLLQTRETFKVFLANSL